jgi:hypothetical protein
MIRHAGVVNAWRMKTALLVLPAGPPDEVPPKLRAPLADLRQAQVWHSPASNAFHAIVVD